MSDNPKSLIKKSTKALDEAFIRILEVIPEVIGFLQIMISPLAIGIVLGALIYAAEPSRLGLILGGCTAAIGLVIGVFCAANEWKGKGTVHFMSRTMATPELDDPESDDEPDEGRMDRVE